MDLDSYKDRKGKLYLFCGYRKHDYELFDMISKEYNMMMINSPSILTKELVDIIKPEMLFFPNWSWKVPKEIVDNYKCICFHEGDLPKGRGGSPIQNHIYRKLYNIKVTAYIMNDRIDAGPILCKYPLSLKGSLEEIFDRIKQANYHLIKEIIEDNPKAIPQDDNQAIYYDRRKPHMSEIKTLDVPFVEIYDFIRMLADPYPNAFLDVGTKRILFKSCQMIDDGVSITGIIIKNPKIRVCDT